jgi:hypothetical protein
LISNLENPHRKWNKLLYHCHLELEVTAVYVASYASVSSEPALQLWVASVAVKWLGEWTSVGCVKKLL